MSKRDENKNELQDSFQDSIYSIGILIIIFLFLLFFIIAIFQSFSKLEISVLDVINVFEVIFIIVALIFHKKIKNFVLQVSRKILDFLTTLDIISSFSLLIFGIYLSNAFEISYWWFVLLSLVLAVMCTIKNYVIYLLVDIRDSLKKLADRADRKENNE